MMSRKPVETDVAIRIPISWQKYGAVGLLDQDSFAYFDISFRHGVSA